MKKSRFSAEEKMVIVLTGLKGNKTVAAICKEYGISQAQYYKWRDRFLEAGRSALESPENTNQVQQLEKKIQELEQIIGKQAIVIETLKKDCHTEWRQIARQLIEQGFSISEAMKYLGMSRSGYYYKKRGYKRKRDDGDVIGEILLLKGKHPSFGYRRIWAMLRRRGWKINKKRVYRVMKENGLLLESKRKKVRK
ncbi:IS3 family transposase [Pseudothermotoga thermarum]|uniref:Transposase IS3/IS911 family protein n=1 Tax=Pseudothermotoga thermarum DSM 5069 TaxID=688269 RepID=F7YUI7_9THEM|nr:IS3 family transposase [Pseudothermotoga thermarum]AEH51458.1 transposase IS3/IS911 family protein [Pseudothermotoga thermarum DSM 5069]